MTKDLHECNTKNIVARCRLLQVYISGLGRNSPVESAGNPTKSLRDPVVGFL